MTGSLDQRANDPSPQELPTIDERRSGRSYRYFYALGLTEQMKVTLVGEAPLIRHDLEGDTRRLHGSGAERIAGEFVFVPRSPDVGEDDGWLIGLVIDARGAHHRA